jgi:hypothetical protein
MTVKSHTHIFGKMYIFASNGDHTRTLARFDNVL